tara:strand:+ start:405 stop:725 length:321 start_codon:yes stop_codon:yes gene_type:complete
MSWANILSNSTKIETPISNVVTYTEDNIINDNDTSIIYDYKYGDNIFKNILDFYENEEYNLLCKQISASKLYDFFDYYVNKKEYVIELDYESENSSHESDYEEDFY